MISIFLRSAVTHDHAALLEDFLACIYIQICHYEDQEVAFAEQLPYEYEEKRLNGHGYLDRIRTLRSALHDRLKTNEHNFLILDGFDTLDIAAQLILDRELEDLRLRNMSILITRRLASYRPEEMSNICDNCDREELDLYWECPECPRDGSQFCCCYDCHESGAVCDKESGHSASLVEPYLSVDLDISEPYLRVNEDLEMESSNALYNFIVHQLEIGGYIGGRRVRLKPCYV